MLLSLMSHPGFSCTINIDVPYTPYHFNFTDDKIEMISLPENKDSTCTCCVLPIETFDR
jgi:hypothetical protein